MNSAIQQFEQAQQARLTESRKKQLSDFAVGDTISVQVVVRESNRERVQAFEGIVIARRNRGLNSSFTVRKVSRGVGVERVFQLWSSDIASVEVKRRGKVRRAKLYYLRERFGRAMKVKTRN